MGSSATTGVAFVVAIASSSIAVCPIAEPVPIMNKIEMLPHPRMILTPQFRGGASLRDHLHQESTALWASAIAPAISSSVR